MTNPEPQCRVSLPLNVRSALRLFLGLTVVCVAIEMFCGFVLHLPRHSPYTQPFFMEPIFSDFLTFNSLFHVFHSPAFITSPGVPFTYPAVTAAAQALFFLFPNPLGSFLGAILLGFFIGGFLLFRSLRREHVAMASAMVVVLAYGISYPLWLEFTRANTEFLVWIVVTVGLWAFMRERPYVAAAFFGLGVAMKLYPFILFALFVSRKQYRQMVFGFLISLAAFVSSLWLESGSIALSWYGNKVGLDALDKIICAPYAFFDHSIFEFIKQGMMLVHMAHQRHLLHMAFQSHAYALPIADVLRAERIYLIVFAVIGIALFFTRICKLPPINQLLALTVACVLLPPVSYDYTMINLYFPCALLLLAAIRFSRSNPGESLPGLNLALSLMAILMAPESELTVHGRTICSLFKCCTLIALFVVSLRYPFCAPLTLETSDVTASKVLPPTK